MSDLACQCDRWPEACWAASAGTRGLCPACMPGNCKSGRPITPGSTGFTHRPPDAGQPGRVFVGEHVGDTEFVPDIP